jgi:hypothetical protein
MGAAPTALKFILQSTHTSGFAYARLQYGLTCGRASGAWAWVSTTVNLTTETPETRRRAHRSVNILVERIDRPDTQIKEHQSKPFFLDHQGEQMVESSTFLPVRSRYAVRDL